MEKPSSPEIDIHRLGITVFVYDRESGEIVHGHHATSLDPSDEIDPKTVVNEALELASQHTGIESERLDTLEVVLDDLDPTSYYRVVDKQLVTEESGDSSAQQTTSN